MLTMEIPTLPDLSSLVNETSEAPAWQNGWYACEFLAERSFTDRNGNDRVFVSGDDPAMSGNGRNIRLQLKVTSTSGKEMYLNSLTNYRPEDLTSDNITAVIADNALAREDQDTSLTRSRLTLQRLGKLQSIAGIAAFHGAENGGLELKPIFGKKAFVRLKDDDRNPQYKAVADFRTTKPTKAPVL